jgi:hypothetical protein
MKIADYIGHVHPCVHILGFQTLCGYAIALEAGQALSDVSKESLLTHAPAEVMLLEAGALDGAALDVCLLSFISGKDQVLMSINKTDRTIKCLHCRHAFDCNHCTELHQSLATANVSDPRLAGLKLKSSKRTNTPASMLDHDVPFDADVDDDNRGGEDEHATGQGTSSVLPISKSKVPYPPLSERSLHRSYGGTYNPWLLVVCLVYSSSMHACLCRSVATAV